MVATALAACGDLFEFEGETADLKKITLDRHALYLMVGETYKFSVSFDPDTLRNKAIYWISDEPSVATFEDGVLVALNEGETLITGFSIEHQCADTCRVVVGYEWFMPDAIYYPFDMVVNANITVNGQPLTENMQVGAFVDGEMRGVGVQRQFFGVTYTELRVYSPLKPYGPNENIDPLNMNVEIGEPTSEDPEKVVFRVYDPDTRTMYESPDTLVFDGMTHGYPSDLYRIAL